MAKPKPKRLRWQAVNHRNMHWVSRQLAARREKWARTFMFEMRMVFVDKPATNACIWKQLDKLAKMKKKARRNAPKWPPFWSYPPQYTKPPKPVDWSEFEAVDSPFAEGEVKWSGSGRP